LIFRTNTSRLLPLICQQINAYFPKSSTVEWRSKSCVGSDNKNRHWYFSMLHRNINFLPHRA